MLSQYFNAIRLVIPSFKCSTNVFYSWTYLTIALKLISTYLCRDSVLKIAYMSATYTKQFKFRLVTFTTNITSPAHFIRELNGNSTHH